MQKMSQKVATSAHRSRQFPRICRKQRFSTTGNYDYESSLSTENVLTTVRTSDGLLDNCDHEVPDRNEISQQEFSGFQNNKIQQQQMNLQNFITVEDIEKWLKNTSEHISNAEAIMKSNSQTRMEIYLNEQYPEVFLDKELSTTNIDLSNKKLNLGYDTILNELQNEKFSPIHEGDGIFILPELEIDNIDPLTFCTDDILANKILPSSSTQPLYNNTNINTKDLILRLQETINKLHDNNKIIEDSQRIETKRDISKNYQLQNNVRNIENYVQEIFYNDTSQTNIQNFSVESVFYNEFNSNYSNLKHNNGNKAKTELTNFNLQQTSPTQTTSKNSFTKGNSANPNSVSMKSKFQPSIIKRRKKLAIIKDTIDTQKNNSVVTIPTNEQSNKTQNFINSVESVELSKDKYLNGNKKIRKVSTSDSCESEHEENSLRARPFSYLNHQEIVIAKALEKVGITDNKLKYFRTPDNIKIWQCHQEACGREFIKLCSLKAHLLTHFGVKPFKCDYEGCLWAFYSEFKLKRHKETHLKKKDYMCSVPGCKRRFTTIYNLASHEKLHTRPNRIVCQVPECAAKFQTKRALETHMKTHDESLAPYVCNFEGCGKRYYGSNALMSHQRCHNHAQTDVTCTWPGCGKKFDQPCRLKTHMRSHTGNKPYVCTFKGCKWAFTTSSKLKRHQKKHTNDRKFVCDIGDCKKAFMRSEHLKEHKLTHTDERFFQCHICSSAFSAKSSLYVHIKKHANKDFVGKSRQPKMKTAKKKSVNKKAEIYCSRVQPLRITISRIKKTVDDSESSNECNKNKTSTKENENIIEESSPSDPVEENKFPKESNKNLCPVDSCTKWYATKSSLKIHMQKKHVASTPKIQDVNTEDLVSSSPLNQENLVMLTSVSVDSIDKSKDQIIMALQSTVLNENPVAETIVRENIMLEDGSQEHLKLQNIKEDNINNRGSARTAFTRQDVFNLKPNKRVIDSNVGASDVVLGVADLGEGLLLPDDLPSTFCQEDIEVPGYQILLLDPDPTNAEISIRDLD